MFRKIAGLSRSSTDVAPCEVSVRDMLECRPPFQECAHLLTRWNRRSVEQGLQKPMSLLKSFRTRHCDHEVIAKLPIALDGRIESDLRDRFVGLSIDDRFLPGSNSKPPSRARQQDRHRIRI
jgi:hypothetical protein